MSHQRDRVILGIVIVVIFALVRLVMWVAR
jgi:hypothetical protein